MRTSGGKAAPSSRWPEVLFRVAALLNSALSASARRRACRERTGRRSMPRTLLTLGINLGIIAFAIGTAIACLRAS